MQKKKVFIKLSKTSIGGNGVRWRKIRKEGHVLLHLKLRGGSQNFRVVPLTGGVTMRRKGFYGGNGTEK